MVVGGVMAHKAAGQAQKYNAAVSDVNAKAANAKAVDEMRLGQVEATERRLKMRQQIGAQVAGFGAQNVAMTGTAADIVGETSLWGQVDIDRITGNALRRAHGHQMDAYNIKAGAALDKFNTKVSQTGTILSTMGSVVGAAGKFGGGGNKFGSAPSTAATASPSWVGPR